MSYSGGWRDYSSRGSGYSRFFNSSRGRWNEKDWEKDVDNWNKDKLFVHPNNRKFPGYMDNGSANWFKRDQIRHSPSMTYERRWRMRSAKTPRGLNNPQRNNDKLKTRFEEEFPLLGDKQKHDISRSGRVLSSHSSNSSHGLPTDTSAVIVSDSSTKASLEVPATVGTNGIATKLDQHTISASPSPIDPGLSMAETLAQGPSRSDTRSHESVSTEKREELARRRSRALIPMIPYKPRILVDGPEFKTWKQHYPPTHSPHGGNTKLNGGASSAEKDSANPGGKNSRNITSAAMTTLEKKPTPQSQSRIAFFKNLSMKSSLKNSCPDPFSTAITTPCATEKSAVVTMNSGDAPSMENKIETSAINTENNANACCEHLKSSSKEAQNSVLYPEEEEEIAFLRSLGWEESAGEDESLTEEEIREFVEKCKLQPL
ncbi:PREDICTED: uncharacterized protein LOC109334035 [Lupinus angustifolius]|uniref:uncharacterized protein LOC109334035 n=1 Tax=Lupinus angustifolius TaxID=3871 RepID=UPI00092E44AC|nr:PREDICTED: uncharacterized protein LOC109334035 [Lupinus angustifolius]